MLYPCLADILPICIDVIISDEVAFLSKSLFGCPESWFWKPGAFILWSWSTSQYGWVYFCIWKALINVCSVDISPSENFLQGGGKPLSLSVMSAGHALHVFVNGQLQGIYWEKNHLFLNISVMEPALWISPFYFTAIGSAYGTREDRRIKYNGNANLRAGTNKIALLSVACGLPVCPLIDFSLYFPHLIT